MVILQALKKSTNISMILYVNGCSHTVGYELNTNSAWPIKLAETLWGNENENWNRFDMNEILLDKYTSKSNLHKLENWNKYFTSNNTLVNESKSSKGNDRIYFESIDMIQRLILLDKKPDFVVIQWSGVNRKLFNYFGEVKEINPYNIIATANAHDWTEKGLYHEPYASKHTLQKMISLQSFLKKNNIEYVFVPYMELEKSDWMVELEELDLSRFTASPFEGHRNEIRRKCFSIDIQGHPNWMGHDYLLQKILDKFGLGEMWTGYKSYEEWEDFYKSSKTAPNKTLIQYIKKYAYSLVDGTDKTMKELSTKKSSLL